MNRTETHGHDLVSSENRTTEISAGKEVLVIVSTLIVERASPRHAGNYSCMVAGKAKTTVAVHVLNGEYVLAPRVPSCYSLSLLVSLRTTIRRFRSPARRSLLIKAERTSTVLAHDSGGSERVEKEDSIGIGVIARVLQINNLKLGSSRPNAIAPFSFSFTSRAEYPVF